MSVENIKNKVMRRMLLVLLLFVPMIIHAQTQTAVKITVSGPMFFCKNAGVITINPVVGTKAPANYSFKGISRDATGKIGQINAPNNQFTGLSDGEYEVTAFDEDNNSDMHIVDLKLTPDFKELEINPDNGIGIECDKSIGTLSVTVTGGKEPYDFQIKRADDPAEIESKPMQSSNIFSGLDVGVAYVVRVRDACRTSMEQGITLYGTSIGNIAPSPSLYCEGSTIKLIAHDVLGDNTYQWKKNGVLLKDIPGKIAGATKSILEIMDFQKTDVDKYEIVVTSNLVNASGDRCVINRGITLNDASFIPLPKKPIIAGGCNPNSVIGVTNHVSTNRYKWYRNGILMPVEVANTIKPNLGGIYTVEAYTPQGCGPVISDPYIISLPVMYWKDTDNDNNWNNINNWYDEKGNPAETLPNQCTEAHIPGSTLSGVTKFPSLDKVNTPDTIKVNGIVMRDLITPTVDKIIYHFGGETSFPHILKYNKAYTHYNWGHYDAGTLKNGDAYSSDNMKRGKWYALSAPLKKMASGDFSLAGRPFAWQSMYNAENPDDIAKFLGVDFKTTFATNDVDLSNSYNTVVVKIAHDSVAIGYKDHKYINELKGVLSFPYFEDATVLKSRPAHKYIPLLTESKFYYYNTTTLALLNSPVGSMVRGNEAYRFVFENDANTIGTVVVNGTTVKGYKLPVVAKDPANKKVLIGNPFMASINAKKFFDANKTVIAGTTYEVFNSEKNSTDNTLTYSANNNIGPLQAFAIELTVASADLVFPLEGTYALTGVSHQGGSMQRDLGNGLAVNAGVKDLEGVGAILSPKYKSENSDVRKSIYTDGHATPEVFFISAAGTQYNAIQMLDKEADVIKLGVRTSNTKDDITMSFDNIQTFVTANNLYPVLVDKVKSVNTDLAKNNSYTFKQNSSVSGADQFVDENRFEIQLYSSVVDKGDAIHNGLAVKYIDNNLDVLANGEITKVTVYDMAGKKVFDSGKLNTKLSTYSNNIILAQGVYVVKLNYANNTDKSAKFVAP